MLTFAPSLEWLMESRLSFSNMYRYLFLSLALMALPTVTMASAVDPPIGDAEVVDSSKVRDLDEVMVVAQPKEVYRLRMQPLSSSVISAEDMMRLHATDLRQISSFVPSFAMPQYGARLTSSMYIRGIGSRVNSPAVGIYVDGMPMLSKGAFNTHLYDVERVDVLRGPQGTLYGQNTEGGLVRIYSKNPYRYQGTDIHLGLASHFLRNVELSHYNRLSDKAAFSIGAFYQGQNGFFRNQFNGERADKADEAGAKGRFLYNPTERWNFDFIADYQYVRQNGFPYGVLDEKEGTVAAPSTNYQGYYRRNIFNLAANMKWQGDAFDIYSNTSYQYLKDYMLMDQDYLPQDFMHLEQRQLQNALSEELVLKGNGNGFYHWNVGAFISQQWLKTWAPVYFGEAITSPIANGIQAAMYNAMINSMAARMIAEGMPEMVARTTAQNAIESRGGVSMDVSMFVPGTFRTPQFNLGLFHESVFDIGDRLTATLGLRYDYNRVSIEYDTNAAMSMTANVMGTEATYVLSSLLQHEENDHFNQLLPKFGLIYCLDDAQSNVYVTVSKGYRAGGFNIQMFSDILQTELNAHRQDAMRGDYVVEHDEDAYDRIRNTIVYKPEVSWNYEVGSHLNLFANSLHLDLSAFYMQVKNQQLTVMAGNYGFGRRMVNAGESYSCGLEAMLRGSAFDNHLAWSLNYGYTHAVFKEYKDEQTVEGKSITIDYKDKRVPYVPEHTLSATVDYTLPFLSGAIKSLVFGANVTGQGKTYWDEANTCSQKFYALLGAHVDANLDWLGISLWTRNLTDTRYATFAVPSSASGEKFFFAQRGNPFQIGVDVRLHF